MKINLLSILIASLESRHDFRKELLRNLLRQIGYYNTDGIVEMAWLGEKKPGFGEEDNLLSSHNPQMGVEIRLMTDSGEKSIGSKRNMLLKHANGEYVTFIDDDDRVSDDYVARILQAIESNPDVVGIELIHTVDGRHLGYTRHSIKYDHWYQEPDPDKPGCWFFYRNPNHLNPVKRELAVQVGYPDLRFGEDREYSMKLLPLLNSEVYLSNPIYFYQETKKQ
jgi:hypothetical protein